MAVRASVVAATLLVLWPSIGLAYRPFDQTDADVAAPKEFELELGPLNFQHAPGSNAWVPGYVLNLGLVRDLELVLEGDSLVRLGSLSPGTSRSQFDNALLLKLVVREGSLQDALGPSVALEAGVLFPSIPHGGDLGASLAAIVSQRWDAATLHLNLLVERTRMGAFDVVGGAILEGPFRWALRPVGELYVDQSTTGTTLTSFLLGGIWRVSEAISLDAAFRVEPHAGGAVLEARLGFTWAFSV
jgi:hypothetical protein